MLKITVNSYNQSALRHLGAALAAMADDLMAERGMEEDYDPRTCGKTPTPNELVYSAEKPVNILPPTECGFNVPPFDVTPGSVPVLCPAPPADTEAGWPDPPQPEQAATDHLDADGIPWDARIHAGTKTRLKADNTWKLKPGVDKGLVDQIKAELKGVQAVVAPQQTQAVPAPPATTLADVSAALGAPPPPPTGPANFAELIKEVTSRITAGQMTPDQVNGAVATVTGGQLTMCNQLAARQDLIPAVWSILCPTVG